jgi:hypothetical protein
VPIPRISHDACLLPSRETPGTLDVSCHGPTLPSQPSWPDKSRDSVLPPASHHVGRLMSQQKATSSLAKYLQPHNPSALPRAPCNSCLPRGQQKAHLDCVHSLPPRPRPGYRSRLGLSPRRKRSHPRKYAAADNGAPESITTSKQKTMSPRLHPKQDEAGTEEPGLST